MPILLISTQNVYFGDDGAIYDATIQVPFWNDVIITEKKSVYLFISLLDILNHFHVFTNLTGPILPFVVLALYGNTIEPIYLFSSISVNQVALELEFFFPKMIKRIQVRCIPFKISCVCPLGCELLDKNNPWNPIISIPINDN